jgi:ATP-dependent Clp protease ATP-binding subunit ClpB
MSTGTFSLDHYSTDARAWIVRAQQHADEMRHVEVAPLHLLVCGLERDPNVAAVFEKAGKKPADVLAQAQRVQAELPKSNEASYLAPAFLALLRRAERDAQRREPKAAVEARDLLNSLTQEIKGPAADVLGEFDLGPGSLKPFLSELTTREASAAAQVTATGEWTVDLRARAKGDNNDPVIGRGEEIRRVLTILERREKCNPLLIGEAGVGKDAIIRGVAARIAAGQAPARLLTARLLELDAGLLAAAARTRLEAELRFKKLVDSSSVAAPIILVVAQLVRILGNPGATLMLGDALASALERRSLRLLASTTPDGWARISSKEPALARLLTAVEIDEPSLSEATEIVRGMSGRYERHHNVQVSEGAVSIAVQLAKRYIPDRHLPDSALDLLDETLAAKRVESDGISEAGDRLHTERSSLQAQHDSLGDTSDAASAEKRAAIGARLQSLSVESDAAEKSLAQARAAAPTALPIVEEHHVAATLGRWTQIPVAKMLEAEAQKLLKMEERLAQRVVGQDAAVQAIARAVRRGRVGLRDPRRPIGSFLFLGTSGVGKTELAKALAEFLFDDEHALTRLDMSEFMERHMAQRLLGAPPGYADSDQGGFLTEAVRKRPYSVLLFDEVEKAHQDVFNLLLQVLDDGRLTDGRGRLADFTNTVVIMTSNIGSERIIDADPKLFESTDGRDALRDVLMASLEDFFRPEFLNRIGDIVVFRPLDKSDLLKVADIQLRRVGQLLERRGLALQVDEPAKQYLVDNGYEPALGARPLQRSILRHLQDPLAEALLRGGYESGQTIRVSLEAGQLRFGRV